MGPLGAPLKIALAGAAYGEVLVESDVDEGRLVAVALGDDVESSPQGAHTADLHPDEHVLLESLPPRRARTWAGGRLALRRALGDAHRDHPILADDRRAPMLPAGVVGSIAHKDPIAVALAARSPDLRVGVDVELVARLPTLRLTSKILRADEDGLLQGGDVERARALLLAFSAKEAIYKAIDPFLRRYVGFHEVRLQGDPGRYEVELLLKTPERLLVAARAFVAGDVVFAVANARLGP